MDLLFTQSEQRQVSVSVTRRHDGLIAGLNSAKQRFGIDGCGEGPEEIEEGWNRGIHRLRLWCCL